LIFKAYANIENASVIYKSVFPKKLKIRSYSVKTDTVKFFDVKIVRACYTKMNILLTWKYTMNIVLPTQEHFPFKKEKKKRTHIKDFWGICPEMLISIKKRVRAKNLRHTKWSTQWRGRKCFFKVWLVSHHKIIPGIRNMCTLLLHV
jgi:hypothetical protein